MIVKARFHTVNLRKWFPPGDSLAAKVARLCILREDFLLELHGITTEEIKDLDKHSEYWRRLYFLRNLIRTLNEIQSGIQRIRSDVQFKALLDKQPTAVQAEFNKHAEAMAKGIETLKDVRNEICGHVLESAVQETLDEMHPDAFGFYEVTPILKTTHYKFAGELAAQILVKSTPDKDKAKVLADKMVQIGDQFEAFSLIERILFMYIEARALLPLKRSH